MGWTLEGSEGLEWGIALQAQGEAWCTGERAWYGQEESGELTTRARGPRCMPMGHIRGLEAGPRENCLMFMQLLCGAWDLELKELGGPARVGVGGGSRCLSQRCRNVSEELGVKLERSREIGLMMGWWAFTTPLLSSTVTATWLFYIYL